MNEKNGTISGAQLIAMSLITDVFVLFCYSGNMSAMTAAGLAAGTAVQLLLLLPLAYAYSKGRRQGKFLSAVLVLLILIWGGALLSMLWSAAGVLYIPYENSGGLSGRLIMTGAVTAVCLYIACSGLKALARASAVAAVTGGVCILLVSVSAFLSPDMRNFSRAASEDSFLSEAMKGLEMSGGIAAFAVLLGKTGHGYIRTTVTYFACKAVLTSAMTLTAVLVAGGIMPISDFPVMTAAQLSQPFSVQRIDSLFLIVFAVFAVFSIAQQICAVMVNVRNNNECGN